MSKVLGISGGRLNSSNDAMCKEALMGAKEAGCEIEFIRLVDLDIKCCTGCNSCVGRAFGGKGNKCFIKDDMEWLMDKMYDADGIIFSIPIFEEGAMGKFHNIMDRFGPRMDLATMQIAEKNAPGSIDSRFLGKKICASYIGIGGSEWTTRIQADFFIQAMTPLWKPIDMKVFGHSLNIIGDDDALATAHQVGINMAEAVKDPEKATYQSEPGVCPHCHGREFFFNVDGSAVCDQCGIVGQIKIVDGKPEFSFDEESQLPIAHDVLSGKYAHMEDIGKQLGVQQEFRQSDRYKERFEKYKNFISATKPEANSIQKSAEA